MIGCRTNKLITGMMKMDKNSAEDELDRTELNLTPYLREGSSTKATVLPCKLCLTWETELEDIKLVQTCRGELCSGFDVLFVWRTAGRYKESGWIKMNFDIILMQTSCELIQRCPQLSDCMVVNKNYAYPGSLLTFSQVQVNLCLL